MTFEDIPYFKVGEEVVIDHPYCPELNGDAVIYGVLMLKELEKYIQMKRLEKYGKNITIKWTIVPNIYWYDIGKTRLWGDGSSIIMSYVGEKSLRKKPKPYNGEQFDFSDEDVPYSVEEKA